MKEASGELNMTLITIVAVALIGGLMALLYPRIKSAIESKWGQTGLDNTQAYVIEEANIRL
mgnify:CR=1 FL=1